MKKCLKIICTYFGQRRSDYNTPNDMVEFIKKMVENEIKIDNGFDTDVLFINNKSDNITGYNLLLTYDGIKTKNGVIKVENRENNSGSFGAYYDMSYKYKNEYDYFFFCEDDVLIYRENYIKEFIEYIDSDPNLGFVCLAPLSNLVSVHALHSGGGCGLTSKEKFFTVNSDEKIQSTLSETKTGYAHLQQMEIEFTNNFVKHGYEIKNHPKFSPLCVNFNNMSVSYKKYSKVILKEGDKEFIYQIGNTN